MAQATLGDEELFGEATAELREDIIESIEAAWASLPESEAIWSVKADNVLGVLNTLRTSLDTDEASNHLRTAQKWYTVLEQADAFDETDDIVSELEALTETIASIEAIREDIGSVASTLPTIKSQLDDGPP